MMMPGTEIPNGTRKLSAKRQQTASRAVDGLADQQTLAAAASELAESTVALKEDLDSLRREHSRLQQAVYEAAQIQRRLCAPRELVWGEFEVAGEIFPVRHLSGDFFKVMKLDSML
ncbi:MAG TPA: hypothetical protein VFI45_03810, partial [Candidatus Acidoferrum sp.]|nr:hypothetical protein [Candidatus Acidoferrum sp.]